MTCVSEKPLALLIPGLDGTGRLFYRQVDALSERYRVRAWEFQRRASFDFSDLIEELGQGTTGEKNVVVVGESFGGTLAMQYILAYPERVGRLVLINTFPYYRKRLRIHQACRLAPTLAWRVSQSIKHFVVDRVLASEGILAEDRSKYRQIIRLVYPAAYCRRLELVRQVDLRHRLSEIMVPTLLFASGRDKFVPSIQEARFLAEQISSSKLHEFPQAGHALLLTPGFSLADYL